MKKFIKFVTSSKFLLALTLLINVAIFVCFTLFLETYIYTLISLLAGLILLGFLNADNENTDYKIIWIITIILLPVFGTALYIQLKTTRGSKRQRKRFQNISYLSYKALEQNNEVVDALTKYDAGAANYSKYLLNTEKWPVYNDTTVNYLKDGETYFDDMFDAIKNAKKYILLEYFIVKPGKIWKQLFDLLRLKAREGVEIKLLYDDFGCVDRFDDKKFFKKLVNHGIEAVPFNKIVPTVNMFSQYRDHRKIVVIDGCIGYVGGINVGDEYANEDNKFGYWKDTAVKINGSAVWSLVVMFFNNWQASTKKIIDITKYKNDRIVSTKVKDYVQPYGTGPMTKSPIARNLFDKMISGARKTIYITTPYFIIDRTIMQDLKVAALSGVDIKIIMPGIPDKKWVFYLSRSYYSELIKVGVKIYEYSPGFVHAKMMVVDDTTTVVGSTNFDFRSLYLHFESGVLIHNSKMVSTVKQDMDNIIGNSHLVTLRDMKQRKWYEKFAGAFLKFFAPFM